MTTLKLGLIGNNIGQSSAPLLHKLAGAMHGLSASYDLLDLHGKPPHEFEEAFSDCAHANYAGINITFPFKERAARLVEIASPDVRALAAVNTVRFDEGSAPKGFNTDYSGFMAAFRRWFPVHTPGDVAVIGCGGVSRAVAFGLAKLGCSAIKLYDTDAIRANALMYTLHKAYPQLPVRVCGAVDEAVVGADGLVNCTPMGAYYAPGTAIPAHLVGTQHWAFDVVYTPIDTEFMTTAKARGLVVLSGYELFFYQGVDAFEIFSGQRVDEERLRTALAQAVNNV
ncbi:MAG: shikimate dehydrogenase [Anaerolineae bacterium]|nr:shikimate dehydrogenase [Anaerolineae bacterium]